MKSVAKQSSKKSKPAKKAAGKGPAKAPVKTISKPVVKSPAKTQAKAAAPGRAPALLAAKRKPEAPLKPAPAAIVAPKVKAAKAPILPINGRPVPLVSVPTDGRPRKNQAGLSSRELEMFRALLLDKRRDLVGDVSSMERDALNSGGGSNLSNLPLHMADMGTDNYEQEFTIGLMEKDRKLLKEINRALAKIQDGSYGMCEGTNQPITKVRLEAQPWARFSIEYARKLEHGGVGRINHD